MPWTFEEYQEAVRRTLVDCETDQGVNHCPCFAFGIPTRKSIRLAHGVHRFDASFDADLVSRLAPRDFAGFLGEPQPLGSVQGPRYYMKGT